MLSYEKSLIDKNYKYIAGVDEVGRGCIAGPMVVCAAILNSEHLANLSNNDIMSADLGLYKDIRDSKLISAKKREQLSKFLHTVAISYSIKVIDSKDLDELGISKATQIGFLNSVESLNVKADYVLTDAFKIKSYPNEKQLNIISGDKNSISIAAASILAKVYRDNLMTKLAEKYREYGFEKHKGYGTRYHLDQIKTLGPCELHRRSFEPIKSMYYSSSSSVSTSL